MQPQCRKTSLLSLPDDILAHIFAQVAYSQIEDDMGYEEESSSPSWWHFAIACTRLHYCSRLFLTNLGARFVQLCPVSKYLCPVCWRFAPISDALRLLPHLAAPTTPTLYLPPICPHFTQIFFKTFLRPPRKLRSLTLQNGGSLTDSLIVLVLQNPLSELNVLKGSEIIGRHLDLLPRRLACLNLHAFPNESLPELLLFLREGAPSLVSFEVQICFSHVVSETNPFGELTAQFIAQPDDDLPPRSKLVTDAALNALTHLECGYLSVGTRPENFFRPPRSSPPCGLCDGNGAPEEWVEAHLPMDHPGWEQGARPRAVLLTRVNSRHHFRDIFGAIVPPLAAGLECRVSDSSSDPNFAPPFALTLPLARVERSQVFRKCTWHNVSLAHIFHPFAIESLNAPHHVSVLGITDKCVDCLGNVGDSELICSKLGGLAGALQDSLQVLRLEWTTQLKQGVLTNATRKSFKWKLHTMYLMARSAWFVRVLGIHIDILIALALSDMLGEMLSDMTPLKTLHITQRFSDLTIQAASIVDFIPLIPDLISYLRPCTYLQEVALHSFVDATMLKTIEKKVPIPTSRRCLRELHHFSESRPGVDISSLRTLFTTSTRGSQSRQST